MIDPLRSALLPSSHGFFTREGGVSEGPFSSLNCSLSGQDCRDAVLENRARAVRSVGALPPNLVGLAQVHGAEVVRVAKPWDSVEGPKADGMVTDRTGIALGIVTADCAPVLFADAAGGVIGAAHAGWRGAVAGILEATAAAMCDLGSARSRISAVVGPCIAQASYEVGPDVFGAVVRQHAGDGRFFSAGLSSDRWQFDLAGYCARRLRSAGVRVETLEADTASDAARFFSHRRRTLAGGGPIGHQISIIVVQ